jgi:predicted phage terminase large subunit-like protein
VEIERITGAKESLARPVAAQANAESVGMLKAAWNAAFIAELAAFPNGAHDDQVDGLSLAFTRLFPNKLAEWYRL